MAENDRVYAIYLGKQRGRGGAAGVVHGWKMTVAAHKTPIRWSRLGWMLS